MHLFMHFVFTTPKTPEPQTLYPSYCANDESPHIVLPRSTVEALLPQQQKHQEAQDLVRMGQVDFERGLGFMPMSYRMMVQTL